MFAAAINGHDWQPFWDFDAFVEQLIICNRFIKTQHIKNVHLLVNTWICDK